MDEQILGIEVEQEEEGRWVAEIPTCAGIMVYGSSPEDAADRCLDLYLDVMLDRIVQEMRPDCQL